MGIAYKSATFAQAMDALHTEKFVRIASLPEGHHFMATISGKVFLVDAGGNIIRPGLVLMTTEDAWQIQVDV